MIGQRGGVLLVALVGVLASTHGAAQISPSGSRNDEDAIRAVMTATTEAFSRHDAIFQTRGRAVALKTLRVAVRFISPLM